MNSLPTIRSNESTIRIVMRNAGNLGDSFSIINENQLVEGQNKRVTEQFKLSLKQSLQIIEEMVKRVQGPVLTQFERMGRTMVKRKIKVTPEECLERVKASVESRLENGQHVIPVVELRKRKLTVKEIKISRLEWEQRIETIQTKRKERTVLAYKFPLNAVSNKATSMQTFREWSKFINQFKPQGDVKDLSYSILPASCQRKNRPTPYNAEYTVTPGLTVEEKGEKLLVETKMTEDSFLRGATQLLKRLIKLKDDYPKDPFIQSFYTHLKKGVNEIKAFNDKIGQSLSAVNIADKIESLGRAYSSEEFSKYSESIISLTVMHQELLKLIAKKKSPYAKIIDPTQSSSDPIIFGQRLPRHLLLIREVNKLKIGGKGIEEEKVVKAAEEMNTGLLFKSIFSGSKKALNEGIGKVHASFSAFVNALEDQTVYFASTREGEYQKVKQKLVHEILNDRSQKVLKDYRQASLNKGKGLGDYKLKRETEELAKDKKALKEYLKGLKILQDNNLLSKSDLILWQKQKSEARSILRSIDC